MSEIILGDCIEVMNNMPANSIDMVLSDFPYGKTKASWDKKLDLQRVWGCYKRICKPNAAIVLFGSSDFSAELIMSNKSWYKYSMVWLKTTATNHLNAKRQPLRSHEDILVFYKKQPIYNPIKTTGHVRKVSTASHKRNSKNSELYGHCNKSTYDSTERYPTTVIKCPIEKQTDAYYSTQKPVKLLTDLIQTYTNEGAVVLDNCCGSGGVLLAAESINREAILIDNRPEAIEIVHKRYSKHRAA